jgi:2-oxoglutarate ferredoxin oxidoreductase subunit beta
MDTIHVHNMEDPDPSAAFALSRISHGPHGPTPIGIFRKVERPTYEDLMAQQIADAQAEKGKGDLAALLRSGGSWVVD